MKLLVNAVLLLGLASHSGFAQVASHAPTVNLGNIPATSGSTVSLQATGRPVVRVNGAVLTDRDLLREMLAMFPYARQHNGFPKSEAAQIRKGALQMIEFEELLYQEAQRRKMTISPERLNAAEASFRRQFASQSDFDQFVKTECSGSRQVLRQKIRRSLLIDKMLQLEVLDRAKLTAKQVREYYDQNPQSFSFGETFTLQTISFFAPANPSPKTLEDVHKKAEDAWRQAKASRSYEEFGLLAEKVSEDDYRVNMGLHKPMQRNQLPPEIEQSVETMAVGQVSGLIRIQNNYTLFRLAARKDAGKVSFDQVKEQLHKTLEKVRSEQLRASLDGKLRQNAKIEEL